MRLLILSFVFISLWHVSIAQESYTNGNAHRSETCPLMEVSVNSNGNDIIEVIYCNHGNKRATGVYIEIEITNDLLITQSTELIASLVNKKYTFNIGDVESLDCNAFYIEVPNIDKRVHCINVQIFPDDPCQAMIDRFIINNTGNDDGNNTGSVTTGSILSSVEMFHMVPGSPILGQGGTNSVFEDHVFLGNIPNWDSLVVVLSNSGVLPSIGNGNRPNTIDGLTDVTMLTSAELCTISDGNSIVLTNITAQTTGAAIGDKTILGGDMVGSSISLDDGTVRDEGKLIGKGLGKNKDGLNRIREESYKYPKEEVRVHLYPNPFSSNATITIEEANYQETRLEILDLTGKIIRSLEFNEQKSINLHRGNLIQGVYFYRLIGDNVAIHTGKFVIR